jgi:hypothetical protein
MPNYTWWIFGKNRELELSLNKTEQQFNFTPVSILPLPYLRTTPNSWAIVSRRPQLFRLRSTLLSLIVDLVASRHIRHNVHSSSPKTGCSAGKQYSISIRKMLRRKVFPTPYRRHHACAVAYDDRWQHRDVAEEGRRCDLSW